MLQDEQEEIYGHDAKGGGNIETDKSAKTACKSTCSNLNPRTWPGQAWPTDLCGELRRTVSPMLACREGKRPGVLVWG